MNTKRLIQSLALAVGLLTAQLVAQQAPAGAPAGTTGLCNDGSYYSGTSKKGACKGHKGVKEWYGAPANSGNAAAATGGTSESATSKKAPAAGESAATTNKAPAAGGGAGKVWLNTATNVYHCPGTKYYGTTKAGTYMTEAEAQAKGARPDHGKPCK
jgi:hypothetical protein